MGSKKFTPTNQRLLDLLRYARQELYMANLLSNEEYFEIATDYPAVERLESYDAARKRIRELEAELQVRDNSANEVLRILREALPNRGFHSEMEAAEAAKEEIRRLTQANGDLRRRERSIGAEEELRRIADVIETEALDERFAALFCADLRDRADAIAAERDHIADVGKMVNHPGIPESSGGEK